MHFTRLIGLTIFSVLSTNVFAEGSFQVGLNQPLQDFTNSGYPQKVDIITAGEVINVSLCGETNADTVSVEILDPSDTPVFSTGDVANNVDCADPFTAPLTTPFTYTTATTGAYTVRLETGPGANISRFDITVTNGANPDPMANGGRLWANGWQYNTGSFAEALSTDANYFALVPGGRSNTNYVWKLDLNNFSGNVYTLLANDLGVDAPLSGYSIPVANGSLSPKFPQYVSYPTIADPRPTEPPVLVGGLIFVDDAGQDYAISPGATNGLQDSGNFQFNSDVSGTYAITIDTNSDGIFGAGDRLLLGNMVVGSNLVPWNGTDTNGAILADGQYRANLQARLGEYHFIADDAETSGGTQDGLTIFLADDNVTVVDTRVYWDDATHLSGTSILPNGELASTPAGKHTWGNFTSGGIGNTAYIDTYVYGLASTYTALSAIVSDDTLQTGVDGVVSAPASTAPGSSYTITVTDADNNILPTVIENITVVVVNSTTSEQEQLTLTETGINTGVFTVSLVTADIAGIGTNNDGIMNAQISDALSVDYLDQLDAVGASVTRTAITNITDSTPPVITLLGFEPVNIELGTSYVDAGATAFDNTDGNITVDIVTVNPVNTAAVGTYTVTYNVDDAAGNSAVQVTRTVNVTPDATPPVITLIGSNPETVVQGSPYLDAGATALDNTDGDITVNIVTVNPVNTAIVGSYSVTYNVSDSGGNNATQVTRVVNVTLNPLGDDDGDGIPNGDEGTGDKDGDGVLDYIDLDSDNDGIPDSFEGNVDTDGDGVPDYLDLDADNDGLFDLTESGADATPLDVNNDGQIDLTNVFGSNGLADAVETGADTGVIVYNSGQPLDTDSDTVADFRDLDTDGDGLYDLVEAGGSDLDANGLVDGFSDGNNDGLDDGIASSALPVPDTDGDTVADFRDLDSDNDGITDVIESGGTDLNGDGLVGPNAPQTVDVHGVYTGGSLVPLDTDNDGIDNQRDLDSDNDGIPGVIESGGDDPDGDGIVGTGTPVVDARGIANGTILNPVDTDGDSQLDPFDLDADNDGIFDLVEAGGVDVDNDGLVDGFTDINGDGFDDFIAATSLPLPDTDGDNTPDFQDADDVDNDGIVDSIDLDDDNDGIPDTLEGDGLVDTDGDGVVDSRDLDSDNDGLLDIVESGVANPATLDADNDGRIDASNSVGINGLADIVETSVDSNTIDYTVVDTDNDTIADFRDLDSDNDNIPDVVESGGDDPDGDGIIGTGVPTVNINGLAAGSGLPIIDTDNDGTANQRDLDADDDGISDIIESGVEDTDKDGLVDNFTDLDGNGFDDAVVKIVLPDSDGDGLPDYLDNTENSGAIHTGLDGVGSVNLWLLTLLAAFMTLVRRVSRMGMVLALLMLPFSANALFDNDNENFKRRLYIGAGIGQSIMEPETTGTIYSIDKDNDFGAKLYIGYDLFEDLSVELSLADLGQTTLNPGGEIDYSITTVNALYYFYDQQENDHQGWASYIKAGLGSINNSASVPYIRDNSVQVSLGLGGEYAWENGFAVRADLESFDDDAALFTVGLLYRFGGQSKQSASMKQSAVSQRFDTDGDGVFDNIDECPNTTPAKTVYSQKCMADTDMDGVLNKLDHCPNTAQGADVNNAGCAVFETKMEGINFKLASADLTRQSKVALNSVVEALQQSAEVRVEIQAHTDSQGTDENNLNLSKARAESVVTHLESKGIDRSRMVAEGYGESQPIVSNRTVEGRAKNRRVEFRVLSSGEGQTVRGCAGERVKTVVDSRGCELDSDNDGVIDRADKCPSTVANERVDDFGCAITMVKPVSKTVSIDDDADGVLNGLDQCPNSANGSSVNAVGCSVFDANIKGINFKLASPDLTGDSKQILSQAAQAMLDNPSIRIEIQAHTDSQGTVENNLNLSQVRAESVANYLESKGVSRDRMESRGYGESQPIVSNKTWEGRAQNRRVEFRIVQ